MRSAISSSASTYSGIPVELEIILDIACPILLAKPAPVVVVDLLCEVVSSSGNDKELFYFVRLREFLGELLSFFRSGLIELLVILRLLV
jgi:hypothetical protein